MNLEDLSIKSTESLVVGTDFKADEWVTQMFKLRDDLRNAEICLEIAQNIYNEYFTELPEVSCQNNFTGGVNPPLYGSIVTVLYTVINHVIGVCGFEPHLQYYYENCFI